MPANYVLLERIELNASAASVTFANIPQSGYTDLKVVASARQTSTDNEYLVKFNGTSTGYSSKVLFGTGSTAGSFNGQTTSLGGIVNEPSGYTANTFASGEFYIPNYTSNNFKSISADSVQETNATYSLAQMTAGLWSNTAAITTIELSASGGSFVQYSTFSLYGLAALGTTPVIAPKASGGNRIDYDGTYWIHTFLTSGTFTPQTGLTCDYLVVAGGGSGGGSDVGGGGGAGGYRTSIGGSPLSVLTQDYTVTVGAGGASVGTTSALGNSGSNSTFSTITSNGGGGGGRRGAGNFGGVAGGSGGGGGGVFAAYVGLGGAGNTPSTSPSQGNNGGNAFPSDGGTTAAGGGGGAGAAAANASSSTNSAGGAGASNSITGTAVTYAGGGGGGSAAGGTGGGGGNGAAGTINTGGGGGGSATAFGGAFVGAGGSGIVIIRYLAA